MTKYCPFMTKLYRDSRIVIDEKIFNESKFEDIIDQIVQALYQEYSEKVLMNEEGIHVVEMWPIDCFSNKLASPFKVAMALWCYTNAYAGSTHETIKKRIMQFRGIKRCHEIRDSMFNFSINVDPCPGKRVDVYCLSNNIINTQVRTGYTYISQEWGEKSFRQTTMEEVEGLFKYDKQLTEYLEQAIIYNVTKFLDPEKPWTVSQVRLKFRRTHDGTER